MSNTPKTEQDYFQQSKELTNEQEKEGQTLYDPYKNAPLSMNERLYFNISIVYVTLISSFVFALVMVARPSFFSAFLGLVWAMPGLLVLICFNRGRAKKRLRTFHTFIFVAELLFLCYVLLLVATAVASAKLQDSSLLYTAVYPVFYVFYVLALEFGIFRIVKRHDQIAALFITTSTITTKGWQMWPIQTRCCVLLRHWLQLYQTTRKSPQKQKKQYWSYALRQRRNTRSITSRFQAHFCFRETGRKVMSS